MYIIGFIFPFFIMYIFTGIKIIANIKNIIINVIFILKISPIKNVKQTNNIELIKPTMPL